MKFGSIVLQLYIHITYPSIDGVGLSISHHTLQMAAIASCHAEKYCHLVREQELRLVSAYGTASASS